MHASVPLCMLDIAAKTAVAYFLLWIVRHAAKSESSGLGVSVGGTAAPAVCACVVRVACLLDARGHHALIEMPRES